MSLQSALESGKFAITAEVGPLKGTDTIEINEVAELLRGRVDATNVTDQQSSVMRLGSLATCHILKDHGVELGERAVRYHLKLMDERGLTRLVGQRDGRVLTDEGNMEIGEARVKDKVGFAISKIELLSFRTNFNVASQTGMVPVNVSYFSKEIFPAALKLMEPAFKAGLCVSDLIAVAREGKRLGEFLVPRGKMGLAMEIILAPIIGEMVAKRG